MILYAPGGATLRETSKYGEGIFPHALAPEESYSQLRSLMRAVGITHMLDITAMDSLGIPIFLAFGPLDERQDLHVFASQIAPGSVTYLDRLLSSVEVFQSGHLPADARQIFTAGKGINPASSRVSAMMEAVERASARQPSTPSSIYSYWDLKQSGEPVVDPRDLMLLSPEDFQMEQPLAWTHGTDLLSGEEIWVPIETATYSYRSSEPDRNLSDTPTGLGAGQTMEEAICHGLTEVIEHDAWAFALTLDALTSAEAGIINSISRSRIFAPDYGWKDNAAASSFIPIDLDSIIDLPIAGLLIQKITAAGAGINVHEITSDIGIPVFSASINGFISGEDGGGLGAHPDAELALLRAITEAVQQRLVLGIQRMVSFTSPVQHWKPANWEINKPNQAVIGNKKRFDAIPSTRNKDVLNDIQMIIASLQERGFHQIIIVNLTKPDLGIPVVKVVVPGLADYWTASTIPQWKTLMNRVQSSENRFQSMSKETQYVRQI